LVVSRTCKAPNDQGQPCRAAPVRESDFCFWHDPDRAEEAAQARKLGGQRRRRESTLAGAYDVGPLDTVGGIRRVLEIVTYDGLGMEISIARGRMLISAVQALTKLLETGELEGQVSEILSILKPREAKKGRR